ncbi:MAG: hypothetical protein CL610_06030 [Anaerolineaceae bacterium]|nr:hypothetical protein [Anaerolineaceae bacterium]
MSAYRIRTGTHPASDMTSTYNVRAFPEQTDQHVPWFSPVTPSEMFRQYDAQTPGGLDGTRRFLGRWNGSWYFNALSPGQIDYIQTAFFPDNGVNQQLTIVTYVVRKGWVCLNVYGHFNEPADAGSSRAGSGQMEGLRLIDFDEGVIANSGGDFNSDFNSDFSKGGIPA